MHCNSQVRISLLYSQNPKLQMLLRGLYSVSNIEPLYPYILNLNMENLSLRGKIEKCQEKKSLSVIFQDRQTLNVYLFYRGDSWTAEYKLNRTIKENFNFVSQGKILLTRLLVFKVILCSYFTVVTRADPKKLKIQCFNGRSLIQQQNKGHAILAIWGCIELPVFWQ